MVDVVKARQGDLARRSLWETGERFADLIASAPAGTLVTRRWTVADTAAHVAALTAIDAALVRNEDLPLPTVAARAEWRTATVDTVAALNDAVLAGLPRRDAATLSEQIRADVDDMLDRCCSMDPDAPLPWLGGSTVPVAGLVAHMTNELQIHGRDVARALGAPWPVPPAEAALFFELFLLGILR